MIFFLYTGLLLLLAIQPLVLLAADTPAGPLIARGDRNFPPYEFINEDGEPDGFNIELLKAISRRLKMDVDIGLDAWETVRQDFTRGNIHLVTGMIRSAQREKLFDFSITHAGVFYCLFVRKGSSIKTIDDARGKEILVHAQAYSHDWLVDHNITDHIIPVPSPQEALQRLAEGRYDCAVIERLSALNLLSYFKIDTITMAGPPLMCAPYAFAVQKGNNRLLARLNEGIHLMHQNGVYEDLYRKWFSVADAQARRMAMVRAGALVLAAIAGIAVSIFIWNIALKRKVRRRTTALLHSDRRFQELCDLLPQTVFEIDAKGQISSGAINTGAALATRGDGSRYSGAWINPYWTQPIVSLIIMARAKAQSKPNAAAGPASTFRARWSRHQQRERGGCRHPSPGAAPIIEHDRQRKGRKNFPL